MEKTLYVSDLDGTLLRSDQRISRESCDIINRLVGEGMLFTYATARSLVTASRVTSGLTARMPLILYNGAFTVDSADGSILDSAFLENDLAQSILDRCFALGIYPIVYAYIDGKEHYSIVPKLCGRAIEEFDASRLNDPRRRVTDPEGLRMGDIFYITLIGNDRIAEAYELFGNEPRLNCIYQKDIYSGEQWLEMIPREATKAAAIKRLSESLGCERVVCFGDAVNDLPMFEAADECYATANAAPELKAKATAVIGSNDDDAVAKWLEANARFSGSRTAL